MEFKVSKKSVETFLQEPGIIIDVRSPSEHLQGRIPGSINIPLFSNEERKIIGTCYKQESQKAAIVLGMQIAGPKIASIVHQVQELNPKASLPVKVHCWRGGLRSGFVALILQLAGFETSILEKGYKAFRRFCLAMLETTKPIALVSGMTGSRKTDVLYSLEALGEQVLDLEGLACHKGSAYGAIPDKEQPSCEQFENCIAMKWHKFSTEKVVWIEDESRVIGHCKIPDNIFQQMNNTKNRYFLEKSAKERLEHLIEQYCSLGLETLFLCTKKIEKRLGTKVTKEAVNAIIEKKGDTPLGKKILHYYDKQYHYSVKDPEKTMVSIPCHELNPYLSSKKLIASQSNK